MRKTILLIHGMRGTHHGLIEVASLLSGKYKIINPDLPGSGTRLELDNKTLDGYAEWLHDYVQSLKLKTKPYIAGHSMGSIIVSNYVEKYPNDVNRKVILMSPIFRTHTGQMISNIICAVLIFLLRLLPNKLRYNLLKSKVVSFCISHYLTCDKNKQKQIDELHYRYSGRFSSANSIMADIKISMRSQTIISSKKDNLLIIGDKDKLTSLELIRRMSDDNACKIKIIPNSGHLINYEKPQQIANAISNFIG